MKDKTDLYRYYDKDDNLLYVGISKSAFVRMQQHSSASAWFEEVTSMKVEKFDYRELALDAERIAIKIEKPKFNIIHNNNNEVFSLPPLMLAHELSKAIEISKKPVTIWGILWKFTEVFKNCHYFYTEPIHLTLPKVRFYSLNERCNDLNEVGSLHSELLNNVHINGLFIDEIMINVKKTVIDKKKCAFVLFYLKKVQELIHKNIPTE